MADKKPPIEEDPKEQRPVVLSFLDDNRRIIEGGKVRRWQVFQWTIALNVLLVAAAFARDRPPITPIALAHISAVVSVAALLLIDHYDPRMNNARHRANKLAAWLAAHFIDANATMGEETPIEPEKKDVFEYNFFFIGIGASFLAVFIASAVSRGG